MKTKILLLTLLFPALLSADTFKADTFGCFDSDDFILFMNYVSDKDISSMERMVINKKCLLLPKDAIYTHIKTSDKVVLIEVNGMELWSYDTGWK